MESTSIIATGLGAMCLLLASTANAQSNSNPGVTFNLTGANIGTVGNVTYGYEFQVHSPIAITALGIFDPGPGGLAESHTVSLWNSSETRIATTTVPAGLAGQLVGNFLYAPVTPVYLTPGQNYEIGAYYQDGSESLVQNVSGLATTPDISIIEYQFAHPGYYDPALGLVITPANGGSGFENLFGPDFLETEVPEPSIIPLIGLGATAVLFRRFKLTS